MKQWAEDGNNNNKHQQWRHRKKTNEETGLSIYCAQPNKRNGFQAGRMDKAKGENKKIHQPTQRNNEKFWNWEEYGSKKRLSLFRLRSWILNKNPFLRHFTIVFDLRPCDIHSYKINSVSMRIDFAECSPLPLPPITVSFTDSTANNQTFDMSIMTGKSLAKDT